jgi:hypothetical protein
MNRKISKGWGCYGTFCRRPFVAPAHFFTNATTATHFVAHGIWPFRDGSSFLLRGWGRKIGEGSGDRLSPQLVQGSTLVEGLGDEASWELMHFDVLGTQFHGSKECKYFVTRQFCVCFASHHRLALCYQCSANFRGRTPLTPPPCLYH